MTRIFFILLLVVVCARNQDVDKKKKICVNLCQSVSHSYFS
jgi:hypothetical protein